MNQGSILVLLQMVKKEAKKTFWLLNKVKRNGPIVLSWMQKARTTLVQPLVMVGRQSCSLRGNVE